MTHSGKIKNDDEVLAIGIPGLSEPGGFVENKFTLLTIDPIYKAMIRAIAKARGESIAEVYSLLLTGAIKDRHLHGVPEVADWMDRHSRGRS